MVYGDQTVNMISNVVILTCNYLCQWLKRLLMELTVKLMALQTGYLGDGMTA